MSGLSISAVQNCRQLNLVGRVNKTLKHFLFDHETQYLLLYNTECSVILGAQLFRPQHLFMQSSYTVKHDICLCKRNKKERSSYVLQWFRIQIEKYWRNMQVFFFFLMQSMIESFDCKSIETCELFSCYRMQA